MTSKSWPSCERQQRENGGIVVHHKDGTLVARDVHRQQGSPLPGTKLSIEQQHPDEVLAGVVKPSAEYRKVRYEIARRVLRFQSVHHDVKEGELSLEAE